LTRLLTWTLILFVVILVGVGGAAGAPRRFAPPTPFALLFTTPEGTPCAAPCMFGIRMGQTSYAEALELLARHPLTRDLKREQSISRNGMSYHGTKVSITISRDAYGMLALVSVEIDPISLWGIKDLPYSALQFAQYGDMIEALGIPDYVEFSSSGRGRVLFSYYQQSYLRIIHLRTPDESRLYPEMGLFQLFMNNLPADVQPSMYQWLGYASVETYFDQTRR